jgi:MFS family permease
MLSRLGQGSRFAPLRNRSFRLLLIGQTTSALGSAMLPIALSFAILADGGTAFDIGLVFGTVFIAELVLYLVGGVAADRYPRRSVMVVADTVRGASQLALAALLIVGNAPLLALCACTAVQGAAGGFFLPAAISLMPAVVDPDELQPANGLAQITSSAAGVLGPAIAGILVLTIGGGWAIAANGVSFLVNALMLTQVRSRRAELSPTMGASLLGQLREGWSAFRAIDWYVAIACSWSLLQVFLGAYYAVGPVVAKQYLGGAGAWAAILTVGGIGSAVGGLAVIRLRPRRPLSAAMLCSVPFSLMPLFDTVVQRVVDPQVLGRVFAIDLSLSQIGLPLGLFIGGLLEPSLGGRTVLVAAGIGATGMCLLTAALRPIRQMRLDPAPQVDHTPPLDPDGATH